MTKIIVDLFNKLLDLFLQYQKETTEIYHPVSETSFKFIPSPNYNTSIYRKIKYIIVHATESDSADGTVSWFTDTKSQVSAHYMIDKLGNTIQFVHDQDVAWHADPAEWNGDKLMNTHSLGIELVNKNDNKDPFPILQVDVLLGLCKLLCVKYNVGPECVLRHRDIAPGRKTDTELNFPWEEFKKCLSNLLKKN